ncbi:MAG: prepilin-type N-terminal cleavage/methylation domain-containing protein [Dictyoglomaceae bacterium]
MKEEKGFSLISLMVLMSILLVVFVGATNAVLMGYIMKKRINDRMEAHRIIRDQLENLKIWAQVKANFDNLIENDKWAAIPASPAIPHVRPTIPAEPPSQRVYTNFVGNILINGRAKYAQQFLIKNLTPPPPNQNKIVAKRITIRIYYANSQGDYIDTTRHIEPSGSGYIKRFENPLAELTEIIQNPSPGE